MTTALFELAVSVPKRVAELNSLINHAEICEKKAGESLFTEQLYNAICRATSVLMASHLEGFLKDLTSGLVSDLASYSNGFASLPSAIKRSFCLKIAYYENVPQQDIDDRTKQLTAFFSKHSVPVDLQAISYKESPNKNTTSAIIEKQLGKLGIPNILDSLRGGRFDDVFDNDRISGDTLRRDLVRFRSRLFSYPYRSLPSEYTFNFRRTIPETQNQSMWHIYIEEILVRRHRIAHGDTMENETSWKSLRQDIVKLEVFMQGLMYAAAAYLCPASP